jgi:chromosome segregation ATPase
VLPPILILTAAIVASALGAALLGHWLNARRQQRARSISLAQHSDELQALRRRYRRRFRALRDTLDQARLANDKLGTRLSAAENDREATDSQLAAARYEVTALRQRIGDLEAQQHEQRHVIERMQRHERAVAAELAQAQDRIAGFESDHGLLRIERDELVARTQRLRALSVPEASDPEPDAAETPVMAASAPRAEIAERNARIHELECQLRRNRDRLREIKAELQTWKYRIAPLALHLKMQRDKARAHTDEPPEDPQRSGVA